MLLDSSKPVSDKIRTVHYGKPDQKAPLVGRCREAPHAHVYSFDRVTLKGFFLGHEGYLEDNLELTRYCRRLKHLREYRHEQKTISNRS